jgi:hypothetical protein
MLATARMWLWCVILVLFVLVGLRGLQVRRLDYEVDPLGFRRVITDARASEDTYLREIGLSVMAVNQVVADAPVDEPIALVHRDDQEMFHDFSILSYALWPRHLFAVVCLPGGEAQRGGALLPPVTTVKLAIVDLPTPPAGSGSDEIRQLAPEVWLVRSSVPRAWESFCH